MKRIVCATILGLGCIFLVHAGRIAANPDTETIPGLYVRGDTNNDAKVNISDAAFLLNYLFGGGERPPCYKVGDINDDGELDISDAVFVLRFLFLGDSAPPAPFPDCAYDAQSSPCIKSHCNG